MPNGLAEGLTPQDFADLIAYLETLKDSPAPTPAGAVGARPSAEPPARRTMAGDRHRPVRDRGPRRPDRQDRLRRPSDDRRVRRDRARPMSSNDESDDRPAAPRRERSTRYPGRHPGRVRRSSASRSRPRGSTA